MSSDWDWYGEGERESVVVPRVLATAVYTNTKEEIVIRQQAAFPGEEDSVILLPRSAISDFIEALKVEASRDPTEG